MRLSRRRSPAPPPAATVPAVPLLPAPVVTLLGLASAVVVLAGMRTAAGVVGPILLAFVIAIAVHPVQRRLRTRLPAWLAITLTVVVTYAILTAFAGALVLSLLQFAQQVPQYQDELQGLVDEGEEILVGFGVGRAQLSQALDQLDLGRVVSIAVGIVQALADVLTKLLFVLALLFFVLIDANAVTAKLETVRRLRPRVAQAMQEFTHGVRQYLVVTAIFGAVVAALDVALLMALGVPLPLLWGLLAFLASFVPTIGLVVGLVPPAVIGLLDGGPVTGLLVVVGYLLINNTIDNLVKPKFVGDAVGLSITMAFLSLVVWGFVLGPLGALLAIPASLLARAVLTGGRSDAGWVGVMIGDRPDLPTSPTARQG